MVAAIVAFAALAFAGLWFTAPSQRASDPDLSRSKASEQGLYRVSIEPEGGEGTTLGDMHSWVMTVADKAGAPVEGAAIAVDGGMPEHHHGLPTSPAVTADLGGGRYRIEGIKFTMAGWWQLRFAISSAAGRDDAVFNLKV